MGHEHESDAGFMLEALELELDEEELLARDGATRLGEEGGADEAADRRANEEFDDDICESAFEFAAAAAAALHIPPNRRIHRAVWH